VVSWAIRSEVSASGALTTSSRVQPAHCLMIAAIASDLATAMP
jgi:hypothetical protein